MKREPTYQCSGDKYHLECCDGCKDLDEPTIINAWDLWASNWKYAKRFFDSKGNLKTRSKVKDDWYKNFNKSLSIIWDIAIKYPEEKDNLRFYSVAKIKDPANK